MSKYTVSHRANATQSWVVEEIEAHAVGTDEAGDLLICGPGGETVDILAEGWWMRAKRVVEPEAAAPIAPPSADVLDGEPESIGRGPIDPQPPV